MHPWEDAMTPKFLIALTATCLAFAPAAMAQKTPDTNATNLNSSRSNVTDQQRMGGGGGKGTTTNTQGTTTPSSDRMGGKSGAKGAGSPGN
jgi:hypothetical protein